MFILMPLLIYYIIKKKNCKKDLIKAIVLNSFKIVFILLAKVVIV